VFMASRAELEALDAALVQIAGTYVPITVRRAFYRAVVQGMMPKDETKGYRVVQRRLLKLRESGEIPYGWIADRSRRVLGYARYRDADEFARTVKVRYRQDYWAEADEYVEVWIEKDALASVVMPVVVDEFGLNLHVTRGFASVTYLQEAAENIMLEDRLVYVYLFTDYDPAGMNIADRVEEELLKRTGWGDVHVELVAVTPEQIQLYDLPTRPTKRSQRKSLTRYEATHGDVSVELDAMPPDVLRNIVRERIERHMDPWRLQQMQMVEQQERDGLAQLLAGGER
jgi:hypothetical protein